MYSNSVSSSELRARSSFLARAQGLPDSRLAPSRRRAEFELPSAFRDGPTSETREASARASRRSSSTAACCSEACRVVVNRLRPFINFRDAPFNP